MEEIEESDGSECEYQHNFELPKEMVKGCFEQLKIEEKTAQKERLDQNVTPFLSVPTSVVEIIFFVCQEFQQTAEVRYLTLEIFDRFISKQFTLLSPKIWPNEDPLIFQSNKWSEISDKIKNQSLLRLMSCLGIASKFVKYNKIIPMKKMQQFMRKCGLAFSLDSLLASQMRLYKIVDYKLHFPNVFTHTGFLIELVKLPENISKKSVHKISEKVIDVTYLYHQEIYHKLFYYSTGRWEKTYEERKEFLSVECNSLFLAAAVVAVSLTFLQPHKQLTVLNLESLTDIPSDDIIALASIIIMTIHS